MANKFFPRMPNLVEVLNQMWGAFAVGPYNALPLIGGTMTGKLIVPNIRVGTTDYGDTNVIGSSDQTQGVIELAIVNCAEFSVSSGIYGSATPSASRFGSNSVTGRSISAGGQISAAGADYAEYLIKGLLCGTIAPGQIVGIDAEGKLTDKWDRAISFVVKSTNPCMVGGDVWSAHLGPRPANPVRQDGDTDEQWGDALTAAHVAQQAFDMELERARQQVDRIAFAGQVPVNLLGATPGQFIVPVQDGDGIGGLAVNKTDMTLDMLMDAIGRVIAIEEDGRARIVVKVA